MALSPLTPVPISWENCLVDLQPTSQFGARHDTAMINTTMLLQAASAEEVVFALPTADDPEQAPVMRIVGDEPGEVQSFDEVTDFSAIETEFADALAQEPDDRKAFTEAVKKETKKVHRVKVKIKKGDQLVRFYYPQRVPKQEDGSYQFRVLAPLASFVLNPSGGDISFAVGLPRIAGRTVNLAVANSENPPGTPATDLTERPMLGQRQFVAHYLKLDPLYTIRYSYS